MNIATLNLLAQWGFKDHPCAEELSKISEHDRIWRMLSDVFTPKDGRCFDVVVFTEVTSEAAAIVQEFFGDEYHYLYVKKASKRHPDGVLIVTEQKPVTTMVIPPTAPSSQAVPVVFLRQTDRSVAAIAGVHLKHGFDDETSQRRVQALIEIQEAIRDSKMGALCTVIAGDFNEERDGRIGDFARENGLTFAEHPDILSQRTKHREDPVVRMAVDHILVRGLDTFPIPVLPSGHIAQGNGLLPVVNKG